MSSIFAAASALRCSVLALTDPRARISAPRHPSCQTTDPPVSRGVCALGGNGRCSANRSLAAGSDIRARAAAAQSVKLLG